VSKVGRIVVFLILIISLFSLVPTTFGYEYEKILDEPWDHTPITVYIDDENLPDGYDPQYGDDVDEALAYWEDGGNGRLSYEVDFRSVDDPEDADIIIMWVREISVDEDTGGDVLGECVFWVKNTLSDNSTVISSNNEPGINTEVVRSSYNNATIKIESGYNMGLLWQPHNDENMQAIAKHEVGHALGLGHSTDPDDIMNAKYELMEGIPPQYTDILKWYFVLLPFLFFALLLRSIFRKNRPENGMDKELFRLENEIGSMTKPEAVPKKEHMQLECDHCGYKTSSWGEVEMNKCPECKKTPYWIASGVTERTNNELLGGLEFNETKDIHVPDLLIDQVLGQEHGVEVIKKAAKQRRHVMMIGTPGTGKSMLAKGMAELLPREELQDVMVYHNPEDGNNPKVRVVPAGKGKEIVRVHKMEAQKRAQSRSLLFTVIVCGILIFAFVQGQFLPGIIAAAMVFIAMRYMIPKDDMIVPKLLVSNYGKKKAPYLDATGAHAGALLGDVRHDPFQSGGLETPSHDRVEAGAIHKSHKGVLFIDEINTLRIESQQHLLTALQEGEFSITGQSERSSGAMVKTEPVPCNFVMVCAGNMDAIQGMHPALRSRIKGYGYEVYMKETMDDTPENRRKLVRFVAQEVEKDEKIPHFNSEAVAEIIREARRRAQRKGQLTLVLRDLGGLVRVAGDMAIAEGAEITTVEHILKAKKMSRSVEQQVADHYLERRKDYKMFISEGSEIGRVNGLAVIGDSGVMLPIMAEVTPAQSKEEGKVIATGRLQEIAQEAVQNVSAIIKKYTGADISSKDVHIQFVGTYEGVEGDSASVSIATAVISALEGIPIDQSLAMTGSLSVRGDVLPVGGVTHKIEAAALAGISKVLIPKTNLGDVLLEDAYKDKIEIIPVSSIREVLEYSLMGVKKQSFLDKIKEFARDAKIGITPERPAPL